MKKISSKFLFWFLIVFIFSLSYNTSVVNAASVSGSVSVGVTTTLTISKAGIGSGTVTSSPSGISCGSTCSKSFNYNTSVTLTATASSGSTFAGWSGSCSGTGSATVTMNANRACTATFNRNPSPTMNNVTISSTTVRPDNSTIYDIKVTTSEPAGATYVTHNYALINYLGENSSYRRGYLTWYGLGNAWPGYQDNQACTGGGYAAIQPNYGNENIHLVSCSVSNSGTSRTTTFRVRFDPVFTSPVIDNDIAGYGCSTISGTRVCNGWINFQTNFNLLFPTPTPDLKVTTNYVSNSDGPTETYYNNAITLSWGSVANAASCTLNGASVSPSGGTSTATVTATSNTFTLNCINLSGQSGSDSVTVTVPPPPTSFTKTCNTLGDQVTLNWTLPSGYTGGYVRSTPWGTLPFHVNVISGTTTNVTVTPSTTYSGIYLHTRASNGAWSSTRYLADFACTPLLPDGNISGSSTCTIAAGSSSCSVTLTWSTTNPIGTSAITASGMTSVSGNSGTRSFTVPYSSRTFYLYNGGYLLDQKTVTASCVSGTAWSGSSCRSYSVSSSVSGSGGTISGSQTIPYGSTATFTVTPNSGYTTSVGGTCGGTLSGNTYTTNPITSNCTVVASFSINAYTLTVSKSGAGSGTVTSSPSGISCGSTCSRSFNYNTSVTLTATPSTGSRFSGWSGICSGTGTCTTTMSTSKSVTATFTLRSYTVTASAGSNGSINPSSQTITYGGTATYTITPNPGYVPSVGGTCGGTLSGNTYTTNPVTGNCTVTVSFLQMTGTITPATSSCSIALNASSCNTTLTWSTTNPIGTSAITAVGMTSVNGNSGSQPFPVPYGGRTFYLYNNAVLLDTATATAICGSGAWNGSRCAQIVVTATAGSNGTISPSSQSVPYGDTTTYTVTPDSGYIPSVGGTCGGTLSGNTYTTNPITSSCTVIASFIQTTGSITASGCTIAEGASSCNSNISWSTTNPQSGVTSMVKTPNSTGTTVGTGNSGSTSYAVPYNSRTFVLMHDGIVIDSATATSACAFSTHWDNSSSTCITNAPVNAFSGTPLTIYKGRSATLTWNSPAADYCNGTEFSTGIPGNSATRSGSVIVTPTVTTTYTLSCTNPTDTDTDEVTIKVINLVIKEN